MLDCHAYEQFSISVRLSVYYKVAQCARRKFYAGFGWIPKLKHCDGYYNEGWVYSCSSSSKGGRLSREVRYRTWCSSERVFTMKLYYLIIGAS